MPLSSSKSQNSSVRNAGAPSFTKANVTHICDDWVGKGPWCIFLAYIWLIRDICIWIFEIYVGHKFIKYLGSFQLEVSIGDEGALYSLPDLYPSVRNAGAHCLILLFCFKFSFFEVTVSNFNI